MNKYLLTLLALGTILGSGKTFAADCVPAPDCASLGYNQNATDCTGSFLKCPWDVTKAACKAGVKPVTCVVGSLLGSNQLCYEKELPDGVKPIAVVFDPVNQLAVAPTDAGRAMWAASAYQNTDVTGLTNCSQANMKTCGVDGRENTQKLLIGLNKEYPAASLANTYMPPACLRFDFCKMGNWFLPSIRDLITIYDNLSTVNAGLNILDPSVSKEITASANWSSTEASATTAFAANIDYGQHGGYLKNSAYFVRPVIYYGTSCQVANCQTCVSGNTNKCSACKSGYSLTTTGTCTSSTPVYDCAANYTKYNTINTKLKTALLKNSCTGYYTWSFITPISMGETCSQFNTRINNEISEYNTKCPNKTISPINAARCTSCCDGGGTGFGALYYCTDSSNNSGDLVIK